VEGECCACSGWLMGETVVACLGPTESMNLFTAINHAMDIALETDKTACRTYCSTPLWCFGCVLLPSTLGVLLGLFGEDVGFGGVFRCSMGLQDKHGGSGWTSLALRLVAGVSGPRKRSDAHSFMDGVG
jgi:hypothetical protein